jgi:hypothetical protein
VQVSQVVNGTSKKVSDTAPAAARVVTIAEALEKMVKQFTIADTVR